MFFGWHVVTAAFLLALWGWGLGFYGPSIYLVVLADAHGWSTSTVSIAITVYYVIGALLVAGLGHAMARFGQRRTVLAGILAMAAGVTGLTVLHRVWQLYLAFAVMAIGWACMSGAAVNIIVAPWFARRRGLALSLALAGASSGGIVIAPVLLALIALLGFRAGVWAAVGTMLALLLPIVAITLGRTPGAMGVGPDGDPASVAAPPSARTASPRPAGVFRGLRYWTISGAFALGLAAQVGLLTHEVAFLSPLLGTAGAGIALSVTTFCALAGRVLLGAAVDRLDVRLASCANFLLEVAGIVLLITRPSRAALYAGCVLFGLGIGNMVSLPGLLVQREFAPERFAGVISMVVATNQFTFAFAPAVIGILRDRTGDYEAALWLCVGLELAAAGIVMLGRRRPGR